MTYIKSLIGILIFAAVAFLCWKWFSPAPPLNPPGKLAPVVFNELPDSFEKVTEQLLRRPLVKNTESNGKTAGFNKTAGFRKLNSSGIDFANQFSRSNPNRFMETGSGVAIGDYDNDGLNDVYLVGAEVPNRLYRNLGNLEFEDVTEKAGVTGSYNGQDQIGSGATFADVDNDGFLDLFVCNMDGPTLLYMNMGDGTFVEQAELRSVRYEGASKVANFCDYDQDGDLDFYLLTYQDIPTQETHPFQVVNGVETIKPGLEEYYDLLDDHSILAGEHDILYRNNGDGTFEQVTEEAGVKRYDAGLGMIWFDFDNDGWQDIFVSSDFKRPDHLYRNLGNGKFEDVLPDVVKRTPWFSMGTDFGDINNDGLLDFIVVDMAGTTHYKQKVDMGGMDDAGPFLASGNPRQAMKNCLYINSGSGPFFEAAGMAGMSASDWSWAVRMVDMDDDGQLDVFISNGHARDVMNADIQEENRALRRNFEDSYAAMPSRQEANLAFRNLGDLQFESVESDWGIDHVGVSHGASFADLDNDGDLDLVVNNYYEPTLVYENQSNSRRVQFELRCKDNNFYGVGTTVRLWHDEKVQTRVLSPTRGYISSDPPTIHFGLGDSEKIERVEVTWPDGKVQTFADVEPGYLYRILESNDRQLASTNEKPEALFQEVAKDLGVDFEHKERPLDDFQREPLLPYKLSELGSGLAWGDVNGDGFVDIYCGGAAGQVGNLFLNESGKRFVKKMGPWKRHDRYEDMGALFFDSDGDGDLDLYVVSGSNECSRDDPVLRDRLYLNDGNGEFEKAERSALPNVKDSGSGVVAADFDHDGDLDLFVGSRAIPGQYPLTPESRLLENRGGKFVDVTDSIAPELKRVGLVNSATWSDFNDDGWMDLVVALDWGPVTIFENVEGKLENVTEKVGLAETLGWWRGIAVADLDDDGDLDYVVTNQGINTKYHADPEHPHRLYYKDIDRSGTLDLVEAEYEDGVEFPVRGRSCSSNAMPFVADKFVRYKDFALASLDEIYPQDQLDRFLEVNQLRSSILWNQNGKFLVQPLPRHAQISPAFGVAVADFDLDGKQDIFMANNFFASQPETGFMDGGLSWLLTGAGDQKFTAVWPNRSGIVIDEATYTAAVCDFDNDGDMDVAAGVNNGRMRLLQNNLKQPKSVRIILPRKKINLLGAKLLLTGDGFARQIELGSGGSYLSQSAMGDVVIPSALAKRIDRVVLKVQGKVVAESDFTLEEGKFNFDLTEIESP